MRWMFILLLLANIGFAAYIQFLPEQSGDAQLVRQQIHPEKIKLLSPSQPPPVPDKPAAKLMACLEWGGFAGNELARAEAALAKLELGDKLTQRSLEETTGYWVYIAPLKTKQDAEKKITELKGLGITEYFLVQEGSKWRNAISLGIYKTEEAAKKKLDDLQEQGVKSAVTGERGDLVRQVMFVIRNPAEPAQAKLVELQQSFPGSELKSVICPPPEEKPKAG